MSKIILVDFNMFFVYKQFPIKCSFLMEDIRNTSKTLEYSVITYFYPKIFKFKIILLNILMILNLNITKY